MSRLQLITRKVNEEIGTSYEIDGGEEQSFDDAGCPVGTTFVIRDLFYNIPARAKFLKKDVSEGNAVSNIIDKTALSHPEIAFTYIKDGKQVLRTFGDGKLISAIYSVFGKDFAKGLIPVDYQLDAIKVYGYISKPEHSVICRIFLSTEGTSKPERLWLHLRRLLRAQLWLENFRRVSLISNCRVKLLM